MKNDLNDKMRVNFYFLDEYIGMIHHDRTVSINMGIFCSAK